MSEFVIHNKVISSVILILVAFLLRWMIIKYLQNHPDDEEKMHRRWISRVKNATRFIIAMGLIIIWLFELKYLALSIAAFAVALVIATREYIQCLLGSVYQTAIKMFVIGDWVQIGDHCGEVVQTDWFTTTLLEIDTENNSLSYTGKTLVLPNNLLITSTVTNFNFMRRYVAHTFSIVRDSDVINVFEAKTFILSKAKAYCEPFEEVAQRYNTLIEKRLGVNIEGPEPSVRITTTSLGKNQFDVTIFCPTPEVVSIEQKLMEDFMTWWYAAKQTQPQ